jgi:rRNA-processing protein FCF1
MAGDDDEIEAVIPTEFADCVSREDLEATSKRMEEKMDTMVHKSVHDALITMDLGTILDRLEKRMTEHVDRVATLETRPPQQQPLLPQQQPPPRHQQPPPHAFLLDDAVVDARENYDEVATRDARLRRCLRQNMVGMGDNQ